MLDDFAQGCISQIGGNRAQVVFHGLHQGLHVGIGKTLGELLEIFLQQRPGTLDQGQHLLLLLGRGCDCAADRALAQQRGHHGLLVLQIRLRVVLGENRGEKRVLLRVGTGQGELGGEKIRLKVCHRRVDGGRQRCHQIVGGRQSAGLNIFTVGVEERRQTLAQFRRQPGLAQQFGVPDYFLQ